MSDSSQKHPSIDDDLVIVLLDLGEFGRITSQNIDCYLSADAIDTLTAIASSK